MLLAATEAKLMQVPPDLIMQAIGWLHSTMAVVGTLLIMMALDVASGLMKAAIQHKLNSVTSYEGMCKKAVMILAVGMARVLEPYAGAMPLSTLVASLYTLTEGLSVLENIRDSGVPVPRQLLTVLEFFGRDADVVQPSQQSVTVGHVTNMEVHNDHATANPELKKTDSVIIKATEVKVMPPEPLEDTKPEKGPP